MIKKNNLNKFEENMDKKFPKINLFKLTNNYG